MIATGMSDMFKAVRDMASDVTGIRVLGEQRAAVVVSIDAKLDATRVTMDERDAALKKRTDEHADRIKAMEQTIRDREGLFRHARRAGIAFVSGIGMVVVAVIAYGGAWVFKKLFGIDISPFLGR